MIPDRIIEQGTLRARDGRAAVEVRLPWYRALPASCISAAKLTIDGVEAPTETLRWEMNGEEFTFGEMTTNTQEWWFPPTPPCSRETSRWTPASTRSGSI